MSYDEWPPYVSVAERRRKAKREMQRLRKKGLDVQPIEIEGRKIARTFWGQAWCDHLESFSDYENRLPRGRTYVRNGSVCHLDIGNGKVTAFVSGSEIYETDVKIDRLAKKKWNKVKSRCAGQIGSLLELLQGKLSENVMAVVTDRENGLFPSPGEIHFDCDCPDWATMCKHVAAVLYGVGARLDEKPELLFRLRGVDHEELVATEADTAVSSATRRGGKRRTLAADELSGVFGIDLDAGPETEEASAATPMRKRGRSSGGRAAKGRPKNNLTASTSETEGRGEARPGKPARCSPVDTKKSPSKKTVAKSPKKKAVRKKSPKKTTASKTASDKAGKKSKNGSRTKKAKKKTARKKATKKKSPK